VARPLLPTLPTQQAPRNGIALVTGTPAVHINSRSKAGCLARIQSSPSPLPLNKGDCMDGYTGQAISELMVDLGVLTKDLENAGESAAAAAIFSNAAPLLDMDEDRRCRRPISCGMRLWATFYVARCDKLVEGSAGSLLLRAGTYNPFC
jgi:hypothetical protein